MWVEGNFLRRSVDRALGNLIELVGKENTS